MTISMSNRYVVGFAILSYCRGDSGTRWSGVYACYLPVSVVNLALLRTSTMLLRELIVPFILKFPTMIPNRKQKKIRALSKQLGTLESNRSNHELS